MFNVDVDTSGVVGGGGGPYVYASFPVDVVVYFHMQPSTIRYICALYCYWSILEKFYMCISGKIVPLVIPLSIFLLPYIGFMCDLFKGVEHFIVPSSDFLASQCLVWSAFFSCLPLIWCSHPRELRMGKLVPLLKVTDGCDLAYRKEWIWLHCVPHDY